MLAEKIEHAIVQKYHFDVPVIIRSVAEIKQAIAGNPFLDHKNIHTEKLHITFLSSPPEKSALENIKKINYAPDQFIISGKDVFLHCPGSYGETKLSNKFFEQKLKVHATTRNWKTINKLAEIASGNS